MIATPFFYSRELPNIPNFGFIRVHLPKKKDKQQRSKKAIQEGDSSPKQETKQHKRYKKEPRRAMLLDVDIQAVSSPEPTPQYQPKDQTFSQNLPQPEGVSLNAFLDSFKDHVPLCFDIIKRGSLPGISFN